MSGTVIPAGGYHNMTSSANVSPRPATIIGVLCATTSSGTFTVYDSATTGTGTPITGAVTPAAGSFTPIYASANTGIYVAIGATINITVIFA